MKAKNEFIFKTGKAINDIASDLYLLQIGERIPSISEFQEKYHLSRGTVQNALNHFKKQGVITVTSNGHLGSKLLTINKPFFRSFLFENQLFGTMPLPYSKLYEGFATALNQQFHNHEIELSLGFIRGSERRIQSVVDEKFAFGVTSFFAAERAAIEKSIKIVMRFGKQTYLSRHVVLFREDSDELHNGIRVGIDYSSVDHTYQTEELMRNIDFEPVFIPANQVIFALREKQIDVAIWNYDEIIDKQISDLSVRFINPTENLQKMNELVIIVKEGNRLIEELLKETLCVESILDIQKRVAQNNITPRY